MIYEGLLAWDTSWTGHLSKTLEGKFLPKTRMDKKFRKVVNLTHTELAPKRFVD